MNDELKARVAAVARSQGRTVASLALFSNDELQAVSQLAGADGNLVEGVAAKFAAILAGHADRLEKSKAVDGEADRKFGQPKPDKVVVRGANRRSTFTAGTSGDEKTTQPGVLKLDEGAN